MLKKRQRLSRKEFAHLLKHGRRVHGQHLTLLHHVEASPHAKFAIVVSKKTQKRAHARNLTRRRLYSILGGFTQHHFGAVALFTKPSIVNLSYQDLKTEVEGLIARM